VNDHQENAQYSGVRDGMRLLTAMFNQYFGADRCFRAKDFVVALLDDVYVMGTISKGVVNERRTSRTEKL